MKSKSISLKTLIGSVFVFIFLISTFNAIAQEADVDIRSLLYTMAEGSGIKLILGSSVEGMVTANLPDVPPLEAIQMILNANGFVLRQVGSTYIAGTPDEIERYQPISSKIIALKNAFAGELANSLKGFAPGVQIQADTRTNSIIITGSETSINELAKYVEQLDKKLPAEYEEPMITRIFFLKYAQASSLQKVISGLTSLRGKADIDATTNSLIITDAPNNVERLSGIISQLDTETPEMEAERARKEEEARRKAEMEKLPPPPEPEIQTRIYNLNHVEANAIKDIIQASLSPKGKIHTFLKQTERLTPVEMQMSGSSYRGGRGGGSGGSATGTTSVGTTVSTELEKEKWSDTLVITDEAGVLDEIDELIKSLDTKTPQVKIEARIVEISLSDLMNLGIEWQGLDSNSDSFLGSNFPVGTNDGISLKLGNFTVGEFEDIMVNLRAMETRGKANIMFNPSVMTLDNEMSQMLAVERIPVLRTFITEFSATSGVEYIDVGISLNVVPHITEDGYIIIDTAPQVDSIKEWTTGQIAAPIISSRLAHTRVRVKDGETFAISGLIKEENRDSKSGLPFLARIPVLGRIFGSKRKDSAKTDLVIFITPTIYKEE